jgi:ppGpp synthetase/RelA/SpoT-type nucleotidyltranferase
VAPKRLGKHQVGQPITDFAQIREHFESSTKDLEDVADYVSAVLRRHTDIHSIRSRIKNVEHLEQKIARKYPDRGCHPETISTSLKI